MTRERVERRLAAIFAADVAGYSRLMGADEEGTLGALRAIRREIATPKIAEHRGRIVKTTGDGLLVEFGSVVDAVRCAVEVQRRMAERNADIPAEQRIEFRIGIHQGDIIVEDGDIFGDGVNLAARLEGLARPGGICVSDRVQADTAGRVDIAFDDLGDQQLKNIARPVRAFAAKLGTDPSPPRASAAPTLPLPDKPSLAVLPFQNMTGDPEQDYFVDGMVEEITTAICRLPWLFVIARNSSFTYKGRAVDVKQVARELGVRYVLEGSVRKSGTRVRITGQLVDTTTGAHIWADRFESTFDDIFALQDQVASSVAGAIEPKLRQSEIDRAVQKPTQSLHAYDLYLKALARLHRYSNDSVAAAIGLLNEALAIDPNYAPAAALVAWCRWLQRLQGWVALSNEDVADAVSLARRALEVARDDPDTMWHAANTLFYLAGETAFAEAVVDRALTLNPNAAMAWTMRGWFHQMRNDPEAAIVALERASRLSPFDPLGFFTAGGFAASYLALRRLELAVEWADRAIHQQPRFIGGIRIRLVANAHLGRLDEARADLTRLFAINPGFTIAAQRALYAPSVDPEVHEFFIAGLRLAGVPEE